MSEQIKLPPQNVTVAGAFNPAIFQPEWLLAHLPITSPIELFVAAPQLGHPLLRAGDLYLLVTSERLVVYGEAFRIGTVAAAILNLLPHTPFRGAGLNFVFEGQLDPAASSPWAITADAERVKRLLGGDRRAFTFSEVAAREDGVQVTAKLSWPSARSDVLLDLNYHRDASGRPGKDRAKDLVAHVERAAEFEAHARRVREEVLGG